MLEARLVLGLIALDLLTTVSLSNNLECRTKSSLPIDGMAKIVTIRLCLLSP